MDISFEMPELQPLTITQLAKSPENSAMSAMAVAKVTIWVFPDLIIMKK